jgi:hypothetical protein
VPHGAAMGAASTAEVTPSGAAMGVGRRPRSRPQGWRWQPGLHRRGQRGLWGRAARVDPWRRRSSPSVARGEEKRLKGILVSLGGKNDKVKRNLGISSVCQRLYVHFGDAHREECIGLKPSDKVGKIAKNSLVSD